MIPFSNKAKIFSRQGVGEVIIFYPNKKARLSRRRVTNNNFSNKRMSFSNEIFSLLNKKLIAKKDSANRPHKHVSMNPKMLCR